VHDVVPADVADVVGAGTTQDQVIAVGVSGAVEGENAAVERVVAVPALDPVGPARSADQVVAASALDDVVPGRADEDVIAWRAEEGTGDVSDLVARCPLQVASAAAGVAGAATAATAASSRAQQTTRRAGIPVSLLPSVAWRSVARIVAHVPPAT
jgi:hypothetical protein